MKTYHKIILSCLLLAVGLGLSACVAEVNDGYYHHDHWYHDGPWMDGPRGYVGVGVGVHPYRHW